VADTAVPTLNLPERVIQALLAGEQVVDLRRQPGEGGPPAGATRFWLRADPAADPQLKPAYQRARELSVPGEAADPGKVRIDGWAELAGVGATVVDDRSMDALNGKTVLALDPLAGQEVLVLALRAHRLLEPVTVADADLGGLPADPAQGPPSEPALSETAFRARYGGLLDALPGGLQRLG
jgi:hypothetical protein